MNKRNVLLVTIALVLSNAMSGIDSTIVNTALPAIIADLHGIEYMAWIVAIFLLGTAVSALIWSKLGERIGNKKSYQLASVVFVIGSLLQGLAPNMIFLVLARGLAGIGNGGMISLPYIIYADLYKDPRGRMKALGLVSASYSIATIVGPLIGGALVDSFSWHWIFYINVPIGVLSAVMVQIFYREARTTSSNKQTDLLGIGLMVVGLVSLFIAIELIGVAGLPVIGALLLVAAIAFVALVKTELRVPDPLIPISLFTNRSLSIDFILFVLIWGAFVGFLTYTPMWAQGLLGTSAFIAGIIQIPCAFANFSGSEAVPLMRRRLSPRRVLTISILILTVSFVLLLPGGVKTPYWLLLVAGAFEGFGNGACFNELQVKVQQEAAPKDVPVATSFSFLIRMLSQTFTTAIFGLIMNHALATGVAQSGGRITMNMLNKLSNADSAAALPARLLPEMRTILHNGLSHIMLLALILMIIAFFINWIGAKFTTSRIAE